GIEASAPVWRVIGENRAAIRFRPADRSGANPLVNRYDELRLLQEKWREALGGRGQVILVKGEAGIGKSRTIAAFASGLAGTKHHHLIFQCLPHHMNDALHPVIRQIECAAAFAPGDPPQCRLDKLEAWLAEFGDASAETAALLSVQLSLPTER